MRIRSAIKEVSDKTDADIELETAEKWAGRALACYNKAKKATGRQRVVWMYRATQYYHEALEHASLVQDYGKTVAKIQKILDKAIR